jgi:outer membrane protein TolC
MEQMNNGKAFFILFFLLMIPSLSYPAEKKAFSLSEIIDLAMENNPLLSAKKSDVEARRLSYEAARRLANPELELNVGRAKAFDEDLERNTGGVSLSQYLENPFKRHHRIQVYAKNWEAAEFSLDTLILELKFTVKNLYFEILRQTSKMDLARKNLDSIQKIHRLIEKRAKLGEIKELEAIKLYVETLKAQRELNQIQTDLILAKEKMNQYLGNVLPPDFAPAGTLTYDDAGLDEEASLQKRSKSTQDLEKNRPGWSRPTATGAMSDGKDSRTLGSPVSARMNWTAGIPGSGFLWTSLFGILKQKKFAKQKT